MVNVPNVTPDSSFGKSPDVTKDACVRILTRESGMGAPQSILAQPGQETRMFSASWPRFGYKDVCSLGYFRVRHEETELLITPKPRYSREVSRVLVPVDP